MVSFKQVAFLPEPSSPQQRKAAHAADAMEGGGRTQTTPSKFKGRMARKAVAAHPTAVAAAVLGALMLCCYLLFASQSAFSLQALSVGGAAGLQAARRFGDGTADTLVIYVYAHTDPEYEDNLKYFIEKGVRPDDGCDYLVVVQEGKGVLESHLPEMPPNVHVVYHANECFDWGTFGWAIERRIADTSRYKHIIFLNSSVRGPFLPAYWPADRHWSRVLTDRINKEVKLVGATISCEGANKGGVLTGEMRRNPHVQSYVVATDQTGLELLRQDGRVLQCYRDIHDAIWYAEMGSSAAILAAGYNIDSLMLRYQGVDWRDKANWGCNAGINPYAEYMYDGVNLSPFEVMFVKVKEFLLEANWTTATSAKKYTAWTRRQDDLTSNEYVHKKAELRYMKIMHMRARGSACFDFDFYKAHNPDLPAWGPATIWEHFVTSGQHEGRVFRFRCKSGQREYAKGRLPGLPAREASPQHSSGRANAQEESLRQPSAADLAAATAAAETAMRAASQAAKAATAVAAAAAAMQKQHEEMSRLSEQHAGPASTEELAAALTQALAAREQQQQQQQHGGAATGTAVHQGAAEQHGAAAIELAAVANARQEEQQQQQQEEEVGAHYVLGEQEPAVQDTLDGGLVAETAGGLAQQQQQQQQQDSMLPHEASIEEAALSGARQQQPFPHPRQHDGQQLESATASGSGESLEQEVELAVQQLQRAQQLAAASSSQQQRRRAAHRRAAVM